MLRFILGSVLVCQLFIHFLCDYLALCKVCTAQIMFGRYEEAKLH